MASNSAVISGAGFFVRSETATIAMNARMNPGARFFDGPGGKKHKGKKFVHPANANRSHHKRTNFQGRRQPDFGQG